MTLRDEPSFSISRTSAAHWAWLPYIVAQPACVYAYVCLPRVFLWLATRNADVPLNRGVLDRRLAYVGVLLGGYHLLRLVFPKGSRIALIAWLHVDFLASSVEAVTLYAFGIGYSPLFFYHAGAEAVRLALGEYWPYILLTLLVLTIANGVLRRLFSAEPVTTRLPASALTALAVVVLFGFRSADILHRHGEAGECAPLEAAMSWKAYMARQMTFEHLHVDDGERAYLRRDLGIGGWGRSQITRRPARPLNLVTIYLEGFQANFVQAWGSPFANLTPNLDRFASRFVRFENFYNAVTPTINALVSSQCGILSEVENTELTVDRGFTRNLACLSDRLHDAGYYQVFLGGANAEFSGKKLFLTTHQYDEVWGWEQWGAQPDYTAARRNDWGLHDTDLVREAMARLSVLRKRGPFHLSILTVNTHPPGFVAPDCPEYRAQSLMLSAIHCTDLAIGTLLDYLEREGYLDDTVVAIMGDHMVLPSPENATLLGPAAAGWFGKVYMAVAYPHASPRVIRTAGYTPDFAAIALDALQFRPVPPFPFGQSTLADADHLRTLVARHFEIVNGQMFPARPDLSDSCNPAALEHTTIAPRTGGLSDCQREKIVDLVDSALDRQPLDKNSIGTN